MILLQPNKKGESRVSPNFWIDLRVDSEASRGQSHTDSNLTLIFSPLKFKKSGGPLCVYDSLVYRKLFIFIITEIIC